MRSRPTRTLQYAYVMYNTVGLAWSLAYNSDNCDVYFNYAEISLSFSSNTSMFNTEAAFKLQTSSVLVTDDWIGFIYLG